MDMNLRHCTFRLVLLAAGPLLAINSGCNEQPATSVPTASTRPSPEDSFQQIVQVITDGLELPGAGSMFVTQRDGSSSRFQVHNSITSKLTPPAAANEPYRGTITVTSRSVYSLRKIEEDAKDDRPAEQGGFGMMDEIDESGSGFEVMDRELVTGSKNDDKAGGQEIERVQRHSDEEVRNYEFAYENDRWVLKSKVDPKAEGQAAIASAIDRALRLQP